MDTPTEDVTIIVAVCRLYSNLPGLSLANHIRDTVCFRRAPALFMDA